MKDQLSEIWDDKESYRSIVNEIANRKVAIFAPGRSYINESKTIQKYIQREKPYIISVNGNLLDVSVDAVFFRNEKRYHQFCQELNENIRCYYISSRYDCGIDAKCVFCMGNAIKKEEAVDNTTIILLYILQKAGIEEVALCGMDGFLDCRENFIDKYHSLGIDATTYEQTNQNAQICLDELSQKMKITFITPSIYHV